MVVAGIDSATEPRRPRPSALPVDAPRLPRRRGHVLLVRARRRCVRRKRDTYAPLLASARRLADAAARRSNARDPGREVDLLAHSQGGVVVARVPEARSTTRRPDVPAARHRRHVLVAARGRAARRPLADEIREHRRPAAPLLDAVDAGAHGPSRISTARPCATSPRTRSSCGQLDAAPLPEVVELTTIGSLFDTIVPGRPRVTVDGAQHTIVDDRTLLDAHTRRPDRRRRAARRCAPRSRAGRCRAGQLRRRSSQPSLVPPAIIARRDRCGRRPADDRQVPR